jgi:hypothetical protein
MPQPLLLHNLYQKRRNRQEELFQRALVDPEAKHEILVG